jgi:hypothetical protein
VGPGWATIACMRGCMDRRMGARRAAAGCVITPRPCLKKQKQEIGSLLPVRPTRSCWNSLLHGLWKNTEGPQPHLIRDKFFAGSSTVDSTRVPE